MKKVGIITLFGYNNYGNRLQMYAVQKIYKDLGFDSEIIRYKLKQPRESFLIKVKVTVHYLLFIKSNLRLSILKHLRIYSFKKHAKRHYKESINYINPLKIDSKYHEKFSYLSVGSDQIWGGFIHPIADFAFLKFAPVEKRITLSPSFGSAIIAEKFRAIFAKGLLEFNKISIREESGAEIIRRFTNKESTVLCDPTLCISKNDWLEFATSHTRKPQHKFILTYFLGEKSLKVINTINELPKEFQIIDLNSFKSPKFYAITPSEWVDYINSASLFLTDSFHGVVFSIVLRTPFAVYSRVGGEDMQTRITNILEKFDMENRFEMNPDDTSFFNLDFSHAEEIINIEKLNVCDFLKKSMGLHELPEKSENSSL